MIKVLPAVVHRVRPWLLALAPAIGLAGCVDGPTNRWVDPVTFSALAAKGVATSRSAPPAPAEWEALCREGLKDRWDGERPAPAGLAVDDGPTAVARALSRTGASYAVVHVNEAGGGWFAPVITAPGVYRIGLRASNDCDRRLDLVIRRWSRHTEVWAKAASCLAVERIGDHVDLDAPGGSFSAPYRVKGLYEERKLDGGFTITQMGEAMVEQATGRQVFRRMRQASLVWAAPDRDHIYWGQTRFCGQDAGGGRISWILDERLFAGG
ncbi:hypothetical protein [Caulobacter endophyticus]|uniref:hypothetical protein n=1 Tax=Caulobacter endophyticus TaxID=2172652 RepID=UPI00240FDE71|nr:hypothetical protein [Caulobacter endophyticus]MDG2530732.1 hypothetical protein [Caulobacter endophyticus]